MRGSTIIGRMDEQSKLGALGRLFRRLFSAYGVDEKIADDHARRMQELRDQSDKLRDEFDRASASTRFNRVK